MKKHLLTFLLLALMSLVGTKAFAYDIAVENANGITIYYEYINGGTELAVTNGNTIEKSHYYSGSVAIPEEVTFMNRTRKVTSIIDYAFYHCSNLTSVTIPNSVTSIGECAFQYCSSLTSITIPNSVTSIGNWAFYGCSGLKSVHISDLEAWCKMAISSNPLAYAHHLFLNGEEIKDLIIPNSVTSIGNDTFYGCTGLTSVTIPNSVTRIGDRAFRDCSGLTSITIPNSVTSIGSWAFYGWDLPEVISKIEDPFNITSVFSDNTFYNATLYVPSGTFEKYKATEGWSKFSFIEEENGRKKCEKPTIAYKDGKLKFSCATEGVTYQYNISTSIKSGEGNNIEFNPKFTITVYATKDSYENSDTATLVIDQGDVDCNGVVNVADHVKLSEIIMNQK